MGQKQFKRLRKEVRKQQKIWAENTIRPKPSKLIPTWLWMWFLRIFLKMEK